jgi:hypothetical protein
VIRPEHVHVSPGQQGSPTTDVWLHFDLRLLVELSPHTARSLVYELADQLGLFVVPVRPTSREGH